MAARISISLGFVLLLFFPSGTYAQKNANTDSSSIPLNRLRLIGTIPGDYSYMNADVLDNIYLITTGNRLIKLNNKRDSVAVFNEVKKFGNPSYIDVSNPLKILVYYKNYSTILALDRFLIQRNNINLRNKNIFSVNTVATSYDNNFWIFDEQDYKIKKINDQGDALLESSDIRLLTNEGPAPSCIIDCDNQLYVYDENNGFYLFDYYGTYKNKIAFTDWKHVSVSNNILYGFLNNTLVTCQVKKLDQKTYTLPNTVADFINIKSINGKLYILKKSGLEIYVLD
ncbi:MAG: hypothetical protein FGM46_04545 [Ferruginibacter sp.]|nr:hypothetical protein [Ferruginibacter sp.]